MLFSNPISDLIKNGFTKKSRKSRRILKDDFHIACCLMELYYWLIKHAGFSADRANQIQKLLAASDIATCKQLCEKKELASSLLYSIELEEWEAQVFFEAFHELESGKELIWMEIDDEDTEAAIKVAKEKFLMNNSTVVSIPEFVSKVAACQSQTHIPLNKTAILDILLTIIQLCQSNKPNQDQLVQEQSIFPFLRNLFEHIQLSNNVHLIVLTLQAITTLVHDNSHNQKIFGMGQGFLEEDSVATWHPMSQCELLAILMEKYILLEDEVIGEEEDVSVVVSDKLLEVALVSPAASPSRATHRPLRPHLIPLYEAIFQLLENLLLLPTNKLVFVHFFPLHAEVLPSVLLAHYAQSALLTEHLLVLLTSFLEDGEYYWMYSMPSALDLIKEVVAWYVDKPGSVAVLQHACEHCIALFSARKKVFARPAMRSGDDGDEEETEEAGRAEGSTPTPFLGENEGKEDSNVTFLESIQGYVKDTLLPYAYHKIALDALLIQLFTLHPTSLTIVEVTLQLITSLFIGDVVDQKDHKANPTSGLKHSIYASPLRNRQLVMEPILRCFQTQTQYLHHAHVVRCWLQYVYTAFRIEEDTRPTVYYNLYEFLSQPLHYVQLIIKMIQLHQNADMSGPIFHYGIGILILLAGEHEDTWVTFAKEDGISVLLLILKLKAQQTPLPMATIPTKQKKAKMSSPVLSRRASAASLLSPSPHLAASNHSPPGVLRRLGSKALMSASNASLASSARPSFHTQHHSSFHTFALTSLAAQALTSNDEDEVKAYHRHKQLVIAFYKSCEKALQALLAVSIAHPTACKLIEDQKGIDIMVQLLQVHGEYSKELMCACVPVLSRLYQNRNANKSNQHDNKTCEQFLALLTLFFQKGKALEEKKLRMQEQHFLEIEENDEIQKMEQDEQSNLEISLTKCLEMISVLTSIPTNHAAFRQTYSLHKDLMSVLKQYTQEERTHQVIVITTLDIVMQLISYDPSHQVKFMKEGVCKVLLFMLQSAGKVSNFLTSKLFEVITILAIEHRELLGEFGMCEPIVTLCQYFYPMKVKKPLHPAKRTEDSDDSDDEDDDMFEIEDEEARHKAINEFFHVVAQAAYNLALNSVSNKYRFLHPSLNTLPYFMGLMRDPEISNHIKLEIKDVINIIKFD